MLPAIHSHHDAPVPAVFRVEVCSAGRGILLRVFGELDVATAPLLRTAVQLAVDDRPGPLHLHLGEVTFLDCAGLGVLIGLRNAALYANTGTPRITASRAVRRLMELTDVAHLFDLDQPTTTHTARGTEGDL